MRNRAGVWTAILFLPVLSAAHAAPELREAMRERLEAVWKKDAVGWNQLTADEFTIVVPKERNLCNPARLIASATRSVS
jgi:hypothetical protein